MAYLWMPEHSMQRRTPRLMEAQRGSGWPQSQHRWFPGSAWTRCRMASPRTPRSRGSPAESMLLVEGEAALSRRFMENDASNQGGVSMVSIPRPARSLTSLQRASGLSRYADAMLAWTA